MMSKSIITNAYLSIQMIKMLLNFLVANDLILCMRHTHNLKDKTWLQ